MKLLKIFLALLIVTGGLFANMTTARAVPPLPSSFYGTVKVGGVNAPLGAYVTAWINGVKFASATTQLYKGDTVYALDVPGDDPSTAGIEGGVKGDTIVFKINGLDIQETGIWGGGTNVKLDLSIASMSVIYLPIGFKKSP
jgi:hypothetical protein